MESLIEETEEGEIDEGKGKKEVHRRWWRRRRRNPDATQGRGTAKKRTLQSTTSLPILFISPACKLFSALVPISRLFLPRLPLQIDMRDGSREGRRTSAGHAYIRIGSRGGRLFVIHDERGGRRGGGGSGHRASLERHLARLYRVSLRCRKSERDGGEQASYRASDPMTLLRPDEDTSQFSQTPSIQLTS